jgi:hypothetical protein
VQVVVLRHWSSTHVMSTEQAVALGARLDAELGELDSRQCRQIARDLDLSQYQASWLVQGHATVRRAPQGPCARVRAPPSI